MTDLDLYFFFKLSGILVFIVLGAYSCRSIGIPFKKSLPLLILAVIFGYLGSTFWYVIQHIYGSDSYDKADLASMLDSAGSVLYGWILGGALAIWLGGRVLRLDPIRILDAVIPWVLVGQILNRFGCFAGQCCYGRPTGVPWAIFNGIVHVRVHPVQLYEVFCDAVLLGLVLWQGKGSRGRRALIYFTGYPLARFFLEYYRGDNKPAALGLTVPQITSGVILIALLPRLTKQLLHCINIVSTRRKA